MSSFFGKLLIGFIQLFSKSPWWFLERFSTILRFVAKHIVGYRKEVITMNLRRSFPDKPEKEISQLVSKFYDFLSSLIVETIKSFSITKEDLGKKVQFQNLDFLDSYKKEQQPVIILMGHYGNWELIGLEGSSHKEYPFYSLYREQKNQAFNKFLIENRQRFGLKLISEKESIRKIPKLLGSNEFLSVVFIGDQAVTPKRAFIIKFLNQNATFVKGAELYAKKYNCPVLYSGATISKSGQYQPYLELITDTPKNLPDGEIMKIFAGKLEKDIHRQPEYWLWSHRRWKYKV